jgi:hypothetical protein
MSELSEYMHQMVTGPGHMRFLLQPLVAVLIGAIEGRRDSHAGRAPFWQGAMDLRGIERAQRLLEGLRRVLVPMVVTVGLSLVFQFVNRKSVHLAPALVAALCLVALPYVIARGASCRADRRWHRTHPRRPARQSV